MWNDGRKYCAPPSMLPSRQKERGNQKKIICPMKVDQRAMETLSIVTVNRTAAVTGAADQLYETKTIARAARVKSPGLYR